MSRETAIKLIKQGKSVRYICKELSMPERTVYNLRQELGIIKTTFYSEIERKIILDNYQSSGNKKISLMLAKEGYVRTASAVSKWLYINGYKRTSEQISKILSENIQGNSYFSKESPFSKEEGSIKIHNQGNLRYKMIKVSGKWIMLHRHLWQQQNGKIPRNRHLYFVNSDTMDCRIENISLTHPLTRRKQLKKSKMQKYVEEQDNAVKAATETRATEIERANKALHEYDKKRIMKEHKKKKEKKVKAKAAPKPKPKSKTQLQKEALQNMTPKERGVFYHKQAQDFVRVVDKENKLTKLVPKEKYEKEYKNKFNL